jgi:hypothetical protein
VGDSRVYRVRNGRIDQLSFDHSLVWELVRRNHLPHEKALKSVPRNVITRSLGPDPHVEVDIEGPLPVEKGDVYLLCSDGLSGLVEDPELGAFAAHFHPEDACRYLIYLANLRGGHDNITVVILRIGPWTDPQAPTEATAEPAADRKPRRGLSLAGLLNTLHRRPAPAPVEEHLYRSADCPIDDALLDRFGEQLRTGQATAVAKAWPLDWSELARYRRLAEEARAASDPRATLQNLAEAIVLLGLAGRIHRKEQGQDVPR